MAIEKNFVVKNGLEVNANLILADANLNRVGIATTTASYTLHVNGGIGVTDIYVSGVTTSNAYLVDGTQVISNSRELQNIASLDATTTATIEAAIASGPNTFTDLTVTGISTFVGLSTFNNGLVVTSGIATFGSAAATNLTTQNLNVSGIGTVTTLSSTNGTITNLSGTAGTITTLSSTNGTITNLTGTAATITDLNSTSATLGSLFVQTNVLVDGNLSVGGTTSTVFSQTLRVKDSDIILGITTDANNEDISTDITANHGGIAIASTEGTPLINLTIAGLETAPATYKKIMWFKSGSFTGLNTDAWLTNYGVGIGSTQVPNGVRLAVDEIQLTKDTVKTRNLSVSGVGTIPTLNSTSSTITNLSGTIGTVTTLESTNGTITNLSGTIGTIGGVQVFSGIITATSGVVTYYGDGQYLDLTNNSSIGIGIGTTGGVVGYGITFIDFYGAGVSTSLYNSNAGIATIYFEGGGGGSASIGIGSTPGEAFPTGIVTAGNLWYHKTLGRLFIYYQDDADAQWVDAAPFNIGIITSLTGGISFSDGTANSPSWYFVDDQTTGVFSPTNGELTFVSIASSVLNINPGGINVTGFITASNARITGNVTVDGNVSIAGTLTYEDVTNVDSIGLVTARSGLQVGTGGTVITATSSTGRVGIATTNPTSSLHVVGGDSRFGGVIETVSAATTYMSGSAMVLEMDVRQATTYTYTIPTGARIGIVSFRNMPAQTGNASGATITLLATQNSAGTGNTTAATGIGTNCTVVGYENGASVAGISTRGLVGSATTVTLSATGNDTDFVSFFIHYTGGTNTTASSYKVYVTKNGGFRQGTVGV